MFSYGLMCCQILAEHGITNFEKLRGQDPIRIDLVCSLGQPPFLTRPDRRTATEQKASFWA